MPSEKQIQDSIIDLFHAKGLYIQRVNAGFATNFHTGNIMRLADAGHPDLIGCDAQNRLCFIEVKSKTGRLSMEQIRFLREQNRKNRRWCVCVSYEDALRFLNDEFYHGEQRHVDDILDESKKYVPTSMRGKKQKLTMRTFHEFNRWAEKK